MKAVVRGLPRFWSFRLNCEHNVVVHKDAAVAHISILVQSPLDWLIQAAELTELSLCDHHFGLNKVVSCRLGKDTRLSVLMQHDGLCMYTIDDHRPAALLDNDKLHVVIKALWDATTHQAFQDLIQTTFKDDLVRQTALILVFAMNNLILKSARDQIQFV